MRLWLLAARNSTGICAAHVLLGCNYFCAGICERLHGARCHNCPAVPVTEVERAELVASLQQRGTPLALAHAKSCLQSTEYATLMLRGCTIDMSEGRSAAGDRFCTIRPSNTRLCYLGRDGVLYLAHSTHIERLMGMADGATAAAGDGPGGFSTSREGAGYGCHAERQHVAGESVYLPIARDIWAALERAWEYHVPLEVEGGLVDVDGAPPSETAVGGARAVARRERRHPPTRAHPWGLRCSQPARSNTGEAAHAGTWPAAAYGGLPLHMGGVAPPRCGDHFVAPAMAYAPALSVADFVARAEADGVGHAGTISRSAAASFLGAERCQALLSSYKMPAPILAALRDRAESAEPDGGDAQPHPPSALFAAVHAACPPGGLLHELRVCRICDACCAQPPSRCLVDCIRGKARLGRHTGALLSLLRSRALGITITLWKGGVADAYRRARIVAFEQRECRHVLKFELEKHRDCDGSYALYAEGVRLPDEGALMAALAGGEAEAREAVAYAAAVAAERERGERRRAQAAAVAEAAAARPLCDRQTRGAREQAAAEAEAARVAEAAERQARWAGGLRSHAGDLKRKGRR